MAELMQLDAAAALVGKSEVTIRRLIKAGKVPFQREKTLTGFIYMVYPDHLRAYYGSGLSEEETAKAEAAAAEVRAEGATTQTATAVRVAVAGETGNFAEYWQKRADLYEEKFQQEAARHARTREELGLWRGRAEHAQGMLMQLLPAGDVKPEESAAEAAAGSDQNGSSIWFVIITVLLVIILVAAIGAGVYVYLKNGSL